MDRATPFTLKLRAGMPATLARAIACVLPIDE